MDNSDHLRVLTVSGLRLRKSSLLYDYYRVSMYEFRGDTPVAFFLSDMGHGSESYGRICEFAKYRAKELGLNFIPGVQAFDSISKVYDHIFK